MGVQHGVLGMRFGVRGRHIGGTVRLLCNVYNELKAVALLEVVLTSD